MESKRYIREYDSKDVVAHLVLTVSIKTKEKKIIEIPLGIDYLELTHYT